MTIRTAIKGVAIAAVLGLGWTTSAAKAAEEKASEYTVAVTAKVTAAEAIAIAERATGGHAVKLDIDDENGTPLYEITTATQDKVASAFIDPTTGTVVRAADKGLIARVFEREDRDAMKQLQSLPTSLATAVTTAEQQTGGRAYQAEYEDEDDTNVFEIKVVKDGATRKVEIDAATGKVAKVAAEKHDVDESH